MDRFRGKGRGSTSDLGGMVHEGTSIIVFLPRELGQTRWLHPSRACSPRRIPEEVSDCFTAVTCMTVTGVVLCNIEEDGLHVVQSQQLPASRGLTDTLRSETASGSAKIGAIDVGRIYERGPRERASGFVCSPDELQKVVPSRCSKLHASASARPVDIYFSRYLSVSPPWVVPVRS
jgi:hypothetical protein